METTKFDIADYLDSEEMIGLYKVDGTKVFDCIYEEMNLSLNP